MKDGTLDGLQTTAAAHGSPLAKAQLALATAATPAAPRQQSMMASAADEKEKDEARRIWNTKNLSLRLCADAVSAASAAVLVAPIISIIDRYVPSHAINARWQYLWS